MNTKKLQHISLALTLSLLALAGVLALLGAGNSGPSPVYAQEPDGHETYYVAPDCAGLAVTPCYTNVQAAVDAVDDPADEIRVAAGTYTDVNTHGGLAQMVYISKTLTLRGGYNADFSERDPDVYTTTLDAESAGRVMYITGSTITPTVEGLTLTGGDDAGLGGAHSGYDAGGGMYIRSTPAAIRHCIIDDNHSSHSGGGIYLYHSAAQISYVVIRNNSSNKYAGGVYLDASPATISDSTIELNSAPNDVGGGIYASQSTFTMRDNLIQNNTSEAGGGLYVVGIDNSLIEANTIQSNTVTWTGGGMYVQGSQNVALTGNTFQYNVAQYTGSNSGHGGGLMMYCGGPHTLQDNIFHANTAERVGGGIYFAWCSSDFNYATMTNNVFVDNQAAQEGGAIYSTSGGETTLLHTTLAHNQGLSGVYVSGSTLIFTNTIIHSHTVGINNASGTVSMAMTLWDGNNTDMVGMVDTAGDITGTVAFAADGYHLTAASDAIDQGVDAGVTDDIDGQLRPMGDAPDLGADEFPVSADLALHKTGPSSGTAGQALTYTLTITNAATSEIIADARVVDTVEPASAVASLSASTPGGDCTTAGAVITCDLYNIFTDTMRTLTVWVTPTATYDGIITNTATVTPTNALESAPADNAADPVTTTIVYIAPGPDLWVQKDAPTFVEPGAPLIYNLSWGNSGAATAFSVTLTDTLPGGVNFVTSSLAPDSTDPLVWYLGDLAPGATATATVRVVVGDALVDGTVLINTVEISTITAEAITINNTDTATTTVYELGGYELAIKKAASPAEVEVGDTIGYGIRITNTGGLPADVTLNDAIPAGTEYVLGSASANSGTLDDSNGIEWQGRLEVDESVLVTFDVEVAACNGVDCGLVRNVASADIAGVAYVWQEQVDTIVRCPDLSIAGQGPERSPQFSDNTFKRYDVVFTYANNNDHNNPGIAHNTTVTITLPDGAQFSASNPIANYTSPDKRTKVWNLGNLAAGADGTIQVQVEPYTWLDAGWTAHAEIYANPSEECQPDQHPNQADVTTFPTKMELEKQASNSRWTVTSDPVTGDVTQKAVVEYYLRYHYQTPDPARPPVSAYHIEDQWPGVLTFDRYTSAPELVLIGDMMTAYAEQAVTPLHFESTGYLHVGDPGWLRMQGSTVTSVVTPGKVIVNEAEQTYETQKTQGTGTEVYTDSARVEAQFVLVPPYITFPEEGKTCSGGSLEVRGTSWADITINIYLDGDLEPGTLVATTQTDGGGRFKATVTIPTVSEFTTHYLIARSEYDGEVSEASNRIALGKPSHGGWCPQRSYWEGTLKAGPNQGQDRTYYFRGQSGMRSTRNWQMPGEYGFWDTQLHLYSCCTEATQAMTVTADGAVYTPSSRDGHWYHFNITGGAHNVKIESQCGDQTSSSDGDILIDPDGYVFNVDKGGDYSGEGGMYSPVEAISGVTVTCMVSMPQWGGWVPWPAHLYEDQVNPQVTDDVYPDNITTTGYYAFFTPPGFYYIDVQGIDGYQHWRSPVVQVITEIVHVNVPYTPWPEQAAVTVTLTDESLDPAVITIPVGSAVEWVSMLTASDTITDLIQWSENPILHPKSDLDPLENVQGFDAGYLEPGRVYRREFDWPGTYEYTDAAGHSGTIIVTGDVKIYLPLVLRNYAP